MFAAHGCEVASTNSESHVVSGISTPPPTIILPKDRRFNYEAKHANGILSDDESLSYEDYKIEKRKKPLIINGKKFEYGLDYAVLKNNDKIAAKFDGIYNPAGTEIRFGLISLFGQPAKQLIVEQTAHRDWRYWIVNLSDEPKVVHDSGDYSVGSLRVIDINRDGKFELIQPLLAFWFFGRLTNVDSAFTDVIFEYNPQLRKYVPANPSFQEFALLDIEDKIQKVKSIESKSAAPGQDGGKLGAVLGVVLTYLYAGKKQEAMVILRKRI